MSLTKCCCNYAGTCYYHISHGTLSIVSLPVSLPVSCPAPSSLICDCRERLGTSVEEVKAHPFFRACDWQHIRSEPRTPSHPHPLTLTLPHSHTPSLLYTPHSLTPPLPHSHTPSLTHSLTHTLPHSLTPSLPHPLNTLTSLHTHSPTPSHTHTLTHPPLAHSHSPTSPPIYTRVHVHVYFLLITIMGILREYM